MSATGVYRRSFPLEDIRITRTADGGADGRTVEAYAAVFGIPAEIQDHQGHYSEVIDPKAFNKVIGDSRPQGARDYWLTSVFYNHGSTIHGESSERFSMPIGTTVDVRADSRGLLTVSRYNETPLADEVLELIRSGSVRAQSFSGALVRSTPALRRGEKHRPQGGQLPTVRRLELGLREYGPTPFPAYQAAEILAARDMAQAGHAGLARKIQVARIVGPPRTGDRGHDALARKIQVARILHPTLR